MASIKLLIIGLLFICNLSFAGYAQLKPPPGWSQGMGAAIPGQSGVFSFGAAANSSSFKGSTVLTNAALNVAGQLITVPVSMRVAANAAAVAAEWSFGNPYLFVGALVVPIAYNWYQNQGLEVRDGVWLKKYSTEYCTNGTCYEFSYDQLSWGSITSACAQGVAVRNAGGTQTYTTVLVSTDISGAVQGSCITDRVQVSDGTKIRGGFPVARRILPSSKGEIWTPISKPDFIKTVEPTPIPDGMPKELPDVQWPVEAPVINPDPLIAPQPAPAPAPLQRPLFIPTGNPVPTADPNVFNQPGVRATPSPTPENPWRVDLVPEDISQNSPAPKSNQELNPATPIPPGKPKPSETPGLCDLYPDILACQKLDTPDTPELETKQKTISITPDSGFGTAGGYCPVPRRFSKGEFSFQIYCDFASGIKPVVLAVAWLVAAGILIGFKFGES